MMNVILQKGLHDHEFIELRTEGFHKFKEVIDNYSPEQVENITGVSAKDIIKAAIIFGKAKKASIFFSMGITQHTTGVDNVVSVANLAMLTGNIGRIGTGVNPLRGQNNVQGACDMGGLPDYLPGYNKVTDQETRKFFEEAWGVKLSAKPGKTLMEIMESCGEEIRTLFIMGENPILSDPDIKHVREQLEKLDFLIVSELFMSETAELADVVLPAASFAEKNGTYTATDRRVQRIRKAIEPIGDSLPDWQIISRISREFGYEMSFESPSEIMDEIASVAKIYGGIRYSRLEKEDLRWPCTDVQHLGTKILHVEKFSRGLGRFHPVKYKPPHEETDDEFPLILTTGRLLPHWHTGTMTRRSKTLVDQLNKPTVEINSQDAKKLNICSGDIVTVKSRRGEISLEAYVTDKIKKGIVFISFHFAEASANILTNPALDPLAKIPELKVCTVSIHKPEQ
jgi:predicted molibdopterin-dependent oxidoreductase YjgC